MTIDGLAQAYLDHFQQVRVDPRRGGEDTFDAWISVDRLVHSDPEEAWKFVLRLVELASTDLEALGYIGAGPLEDLVRFHPALLLDRAESEAGHNSAFREALRVARYPGHEEL